MQRTAGLGLSPAFDKASVRRSMMQVRDDAAYFAAMMQRIERLSSAEIRR